MTSLYGWKPTNPAKQYLDEAERNERFERERQRIAEANNRSKAWLDQYRQAPQRTAFNWSPRFPVTTKENTNAEESFQRVAQEAAEVDLQANVGDAAQERGVESAGEHAAAKAHGLERESDRAGDGAAVAHDWLNDPIPF